MIHRIPFVALLSLTLAGCAARPGLLPAIAVAGFQNSTGRAVFLAPDPGRASGPMLGWPIVQLESGSTATIHLMVPQPDQASPVAEVYSDRTVQGKISVPLSLRSTLSATALLEPPRYRVSVGPDGLLIAEPLDDGAAAPPSGSWTGGAPRSPRIGGSGGG